MRFAPLNNRTTPPTPLPPSIQRAAATSVRLILFTLQTEYLLDTSARNSLQVKVCFQVARHSTHNTLLLSGNFPKAISKAKGVIVL